MLDSFLEVLAKEAGFAPGIVHKTVVHPIPKVEQPSVWQFGVHDHHSEGGAGHHLDLRLGQPATGHAHSWAMRHWPEPGEARLAIQQPTHTIKYMDFHGRIESGYGKGQVNLARRDKTEIVSADKDHVRFNLYTGKGHEEYLLHRTENNKWLLHNTTVSRDGAAKELPSSKPSYRSKDPSKLNPEQSSTVWQAKIDGAHSTFSFGKPGQQVRVFSYRPTERDTGIIEHTHKLPDYHEHRVPRVLGDTVLRGELYAVDSDGRALEPARVGGLLNSSVWKSRQSQEVEGKLRPVVFDVVRWRGKDAESAPYGEKLEMLRAAKQHAPWLELPRMAHTPEEKRKLFEDIRTNKEPSTKEGIVEWSLHSSGPPAKAKFLDEKDVVIRGVFPEKGKKRSGTMAGGFEFSYTKDGPIIGRVGSGMSHALKKDLLENPEKYVGLQARILAQRHAERYAPRAPKFYGFHPDQELPMGIKTAEYRAMCTELLKIAFNAESAGKMLKAIKPNVVKRLHTFGGMPSLQRVKKQTVKSVLPAWAAIGASPDNLEAIGKATQDAVQQLPIGHATRGVIGTPVRGDGVSFLRRSPYNLNKLPAVAAEPRQRKMLDAVFKGHENAEMRATPQMAFAAYAHRSPEVLLQEHNMVSTLPGQFAPVRGLMQELRGQRGEATLFKPYGIEYGQSPRLTRHARKHIAQDIEKTFMQDVLKPWVPALNASVAEQLRKIREGVGNG